MTPQVAELSLNALNAEALSGGDNNTSSGLGQQFDDIQIVSDLTSEEVLQRERARAEAAGEVINIETDMDIFYIPTGLDNLVPMPESRASCGHDLRSGEPNETNAVLLTAGRLAAKGRTPSVVNFDYRYVVGFSGQHRGDPGPFFELQLIDGAELDDTINAGPIVRDLSAPAPPVVAREGVDDLFGWMEIQQTQNPPTLVEPITHVLYRSETADAALYPWDAHNGGHPTNYSPAIYVNQVCDHVGPLRGEDVYSFAFLRD